MLNERIIEALEAKGFNRWTKGDMDKLYINAEALGLYVDTYKSGNVCYADYRGEVISNRMGTTMKYSKTYIDIKTGKLYSTNSTLERDAQALYDEAIAEVEAAETDETATTGEETIEAAETTETDTIEEEEETMTYSVYTDIWGICRENVSLEKAREVAEIYQGEGRDWEIRDDDTGEVIESYYKEDEEE